MLRIQVPKLADYLFGQPIAKVILIRIARQIVEGKDRQHDSLVAGLRMGPPTVTLPVGNDCDQSDQRETGNHPPPARLRRANLTGNANWH